ncbi:Proteophosphoglycan 5 [Rhodotorula toruloides ATCC 204091]|uniref:Proteophosphoglycan 5 n=1 Tax=Rhodotorula toruloides TaxID=5286 RepID=A0A0K3CPD8_RHOTO|nr:Proteophosphoglycan 5 [Rhodotorula toruloides ATCC 204091]KAK4330565.1 Proteophosphoglycan 5 [Rhodotorula toruloides]PRQ70873.1 Proteophosphoglycan 5 [Rhodotorula toruloides]
MTVSSLLPSTVGYRPLPSLPRGAIPSRFPRISLGWLVSLALFCVLVFSHSTLAPPIRRLDLETVRSLPNKFGLRYPSAPSAAVRDEEELIEVAEEVEEPEPEPEVHHGLQSDVTIVSGFYRVDSGKKHRVDEYHVWIKHFLETVEIPIVFYCSPDQHDYIAGLRGDKPITINSTYPTAFQMPPLENLGGEEWAIRQNKMDPENWMHVHDIYGIWTAKPWLVNEVAKANPYDSKYFMWVDAGSLREPNVPHPFTGLGKHMDEIYADVPNDTLLLASTTVPFEEELDYVQNATRMQPNDPTERLQGGWYGGTKEAVDWWETETTKVVVLQSALNRFTAKEQPVWNQAARLNWEKILIQQNAFRHGPDCGYDFWFTFEYWSDGRNCTIPVWNGPQKAKDKQARLLAQVKDEAVRLDDARMVKVRKAPAERRV